MAGASLQTCRGACSTLHTPPSTLHTPHFTLYTPHFTLHTLLSTLYTLHSALYISKKSVSRYQKNSKEGSTLRGEEHSDDELSDFQASPVRSIRRQRAADDASFTGRQRAADDASSSSRCSVARSSGTRGGANDLRGDVTVHSTLHTPHSSLHTLHSTLYTLHFTL